MLKLRAFVSSWHHYGGREKEKRPGEISENQTKYAVGLGADSCRY